MNRNALISEHINGMITLDIKNLPPEVILKIIARKYGIHSEQYDNLLIFTTADEWVEQKQRELREINLLHATEPLTLAFITLHYAKAADIIALIKNTKSASLLSKRGNIDADIRTNTIMVYDIQQSITLIKRLIKTLDQPIKQILIETRLVSIDHDSEKALGLSFINKQHGSMHATFPLNINKWQLTQSIDVSLSLMEKNGMAEILSSPRIFTADQETAFIETGEEVPYQESSENGGTTVAFKKAVLRLKITPHILPGGRILLNLHLNHDRPTNRLIQGMPMITTRQITTNVILSNKETVILGGIYERDVEQNVAGIIGISDMPIVGHLFRQNTTKQHKRQLLVFVTPIIINKKLQP